MRITYIKLENFLGIYAGMKRTTLEIDFKNNKNKIIILNAANGKGKTTLLSMLQPLRETLDCRKDIVIPGELGHKVVDLIHNDIKYHIEHFYGKKNKSFISKNGEELNENGNIKSFNQIAKEELGIDEEYFKIGRIGSNVSNFIDLKATDRKKYITEFIPSIDEYLEAFDVIKDKYTSFNSQIKFIKNTIEKYSGFKELDEIKTYIAQLNNQYNDFQKRYIEVKSKINSLEDSKKNLEDTIKNYINDNTQFIIKDFDSDLNDITFSIDNLVTEKEEEVNRLVNMQNNFIISYKIHVEENIENYIKTLERKFIARKAKLESEIENINDLILTLETTKIDCLNKIEYYTNKLESVKENDLTPEQAEEISKEIERTNNELALAKNNLTIYESKFDKDVLEELLEFYKSHTFMDGKEIIDSYDVLKDNYSEQIFNNYYDYIESHETLSLNSLNNKYNTLNEELNNINKQLSEIDGRLSYVDETLPKRSEKCNDDNCSFIKSALEIQKKDVPLREKLEARVNVINSDMEELLSKINSISEYIEINNRVKTLESYINQYMPNYFVEKILSKKLLINNNTTLLEDIGIFTIEKIININKNIEELNNYINKITTQLENFKISKTLIDEYSEQLKNYKEILNESENNLKENEETLKDLTLKLNDSEKRISICNEYYTINEELTKVTEEYNNILDIHKHLFDLLTNYSEFKKTNNVDELNNDLIKFKRNIDEIKIKLDENNTAVKIIEDNMNKLSEIEIIYNDVLLIKDALDPKKGIPVVFANEYLKSIATNTNKLLKIAYGEKFKIRFNITSTDFLVEVYKNDGTFLTDIKQASQGETSLTNVSLSLAMLECMIKKYNIIYLDEVDCTLSTENRKLFIELLEKQIDELNIEQCFVISHNNEFYDKNIDLILLEGHDCPLDDKEFMQGKNVILNLE
jgi:DNA repair exonuclease SbcCD ATPase subunit